MRVKIIYLPPLQRHGLTEEIKDYPSAVSVGEIIADLNLPKELHGITLLNGRYAEHGSQVSDDDVLTLLPLVDGG